MDVGSGIYFEMAARILKTVEHSDWRREYDKIPRGQDGVMQRWE